MVAKHAKRYPPKRRPLKVSQPSGALCLAYNDGELFLSRIKPYQFIPINFAVYTEFIHEFSGKEI